MKYVLAFLALAGLVVSVLALRVHNMDPNLAPPCAVDEHWDCGAVNHSRFAVFPPMTFDEATQISAGAKPTGLHIPVATIGIVGYGLMFLLALAGRLSWVRELALIGFMSASFLTYLEAYVMAKWCIYCVWSQVIVTVLLLCAVTAVWLDTRRTHQRNAAAVS